MSLLLSLRLTLIAGLFLAPGTSQALTLVQDGKATATIVVRESAFKAEAHKPARGVAGPTLWTRGGGTSLRCVWHRHESHPGPGRLPGPPVSVCLAGQLSDVSTEGSVAA
jgi:hypothetical protein